MKCVCVCVLECSSMTLKALNGTVCSNNGEIILTEPSAVAFNCTYDSSMTSETKYRWSMDDKVLPQFSSSLALIPIPSGSHYVTCEAIVDTSDGASANISANCVCADMKSLNVTTVGMSRDSDTHINIKTRAVKALIFLMH